MGKKKKKQPDQYTALKAVMQGIVEIQSNYIIAMYTITVAIIGIGLQFRNEWLLLLPYVVLFSFQRIIQAKKDNSLRVSAYIAVFLDGPDGFERNYEQIVQETTIRFSHGKPFSKIRNIISGRISSLQLGFLCSGLCVIQHLFDKNDEEMLFNQWIRNPAEIRFIDTIPVIMAIFLLALLNYRCRYALTSMKDRNNYIYALENWKRNRKVP